MVDYKKFHQFYSKKVAGQKGTPTPTNQKVGTQAPNENKRRDFQRPNNPDQRNTNNLGSNENRGYRGPNSGTGVKSEYEMNKMGYVYDETDQVLGSEIMVKAGVLHFQRRRHSNANLARKLQLNANKNLENSENKPERNYEKQRFEIKISGEISANEVARLMNEKAADVLKFLMKMGLNVNINQNLDIDILEIIITEFGHTFVRVDSKLEEQKLLSSEENEKFEKFSRAPIVSVMGHVDHGKTTLLDTIRKSDIAGGEAGGITQKIGAYQVIYKDHDITFIDTPGHEAFSAIRSRGANLTDIVILVVASDDGIMPQTVEAIKHAKKANVPIIVAINKIDKQPNINNIKNALMSYDVVPDDLGGTSIVVPISAKNGTNIDQLLDAVLLQAEVLQLSARKEGLAQGIIVDSRIDKKRGPIATAIVKNGILHVGDNIICGDSFGKIRILSDYQGKQIKDSYPSQPVEIVGFNEVPKCGEKFYILKDEKAINEARALIEKNKEIKHHAKTAKFVSQDLKVLNLIIKADSQGSLEAISQLIKKISIPGGEIRVLSSELGLPGNIDINMAVLSKALIISFNAELTNEPLLRTIKEKNITYKNFEIIYELVDYVREKFEALYPPVEEEIEEGVAEIRGLFTISKVGLVLGCIVKSGAVRRGDMIRLKRKGDLIGKYKISSLRRLKDDVKEVTTGLECGISIEGKVEAQIGDVLEVYKVILKSPFKKNQ